MSWWDDLKSRFMGPAQAVADKTALPDLKPPAPAEAPGTTLTGGKRARKTRKTRKHSKKTHKRS
jgi:hypothetical protein